MVMLLENTLQCGIEKKNSHIFPSLLGGNKVQLKIVW